MFQTSFSQCAWARLSVDFAIHSGVAEQRSDVVGARLRPALEFAEHDRPVVHVMNDAGRDAIEADEAQSSQNLLHRENAVRAALRYRVHSAT